jgi:hypothetical protein
MGAGVGNAAAMFGQTRALAEHMLPVIEKR